MINILYILHSTDAFAGSTKAIMPLILQHDPKIRPVVIVPSPSGIYTTLLANNIKTYTLDFRTSCYPGISSLRDLLLFIPRCFGRLFLNTRAYYNTLDIVKKEQIDIIHTNTGVLRIGWHASQKLHKPHIWHLREYADKMELKMFPSKQRYKKELQLSTTVCITKGVQNHYGLSGSKLSTVIYDGVLPLKSAQSFKEKERYFLYAGRVEQQKGIEELLLSYKAYKESITKPIPLKVAGSVTDTYMQYLKSKYIKPLQLKGHITFLGNREDVLQLMSKAYAVIIPSLTEGFGFVMAETQFVSSLVVAHNVDGLKEQFETGLRLEGNATGLPYNTTTELTKHLLDITNNGIKTYLMTIQLGHNCATINYSTEENINHITSLYNSIL